jgi:putative phage-type endonuclease
MSNITEMMNIKFTKLCNELLKRNNSSHVASPNSIKTFAKSGLELNEFIDRHDKEFITLPFKRVDKRDEYYRDYCDIIDVPDKYKDIWAQYKFLEAIPQPVQKSEAWFRARDKIISASSGAQALDESKYEGWFQMVIAKLGLGEPFKENFHVHHGKKLETIATLLYEYIYNVKIGEFGLVPHIAKPNVSFLGASPDGICTCSSLDGKFSPLVGRMVEIKCVTTRQLNITGPENMWIKGEKDIAICPHIYWVQMQLQLECCDLEDCDFWQCKLRNFWSDRTLKENIAKTKPIHTVNQGKVMEINSQLEYGTLIELLPIDKELKSYEKIEWFGAYIYPDKLNCSLEEKIIWAQDMKRNWKTYYPEYAKDYTFGKVLYYHLEQSHCYLVKRDRAWFNEALPRFKKFWDVVLSYRNDSEKRQILIDELALKMSKKKNQDNRERIIVKPGIQSLDSDSD